MKFLLALIILCMASPFVHAIPATNVLIAPAATTSSVPPSQATASSFTPIQATTSSVPPSQETASSVTPSQAFAVVINDLETLGNLFTQIDSDASSIPQFGIKAINATYADSEAIHLVFEDIYTNLNELSPGSFAESQTEQVLQLYGGIVDRIISYLNSIAENAASFKSIPSDTTIITTDLLNSAVSCLEFESALITVSSGNIQLTSQIIQTFRPVDEARQSALDALSEI